MKVHFIIFFFFLLAVSGRAQEPSISNQNFKGVKSVKFFSTETDSSGKILKKRTLSDEHFYDSTGRETRVLYYNKAVHSRSVDYIFDSLGRISMRIIWTKEDGNKKYIYSYEQKGQFTIIQIALNKEIIRTESNYWDTVSHHYIERAWYGESTLGAPPYHHEYDENGKLVMADSYNGFTEYRYDSLGTLTHMLIRHFEDGECAGYSPHDYEPIYSDGRLVQYNARWRTIWFGYNDKGFIASQKTGSRSANRFYISEAEYVYY